jgi:predicted CopG family antitoxin
MSALSARIACSVEARDELRGLKVDNETYDDVIRRLVREHKTEA